jgi:3-hydroxyisobutyrate dehydrogenase-like beta-hydroxyacid dehydrogenase
MGGFMAANLLRAGHPLVVNDINSTAVQKLKDLSSQLKTEVKEAKTPKELASHVEYVITMLPSSPHVQQVYLADNGILSAVKSNSLLIDASTIDPNVSREVAKKASEKKASMIDAPVSGG